MEVFYKLILAIPLSTKKDAQRENCKLSFIWGKNEDCTPGQSTSHSSEKLFQRGSRGRSIYMILVKGEFSAIKHLFYKTFSASHEELMSSWRDLVLFWIWGDVKIGIMKSVSENMKSVLVTQSCLNSCATL